MKLCEFVKRHNLHDSLLESIEFDEESKTVRLTVDFCYWQQSDYKEGDPETGLITLLFTGVTALDTDEHQLNSDEIVQCVCLNSGAINLQVESDVTGDCHTIEISAEAVFIE